LLHLISLIFGEVVASIEFNVWFSLVDSVIAYIKLLMNLQR